MLADRTNLTQTRLPAFLARPWRVYQLSGSNGKISPVFKLSCAAACSSASLRTVQTSAPAQVPKTEGSNAGVRTVYPKNLDASRPLESDSQAQTTDTRQAIGQTTPATNTPVQHSAQTTMALPAQQPAPPASVPQSATSQRPASATQPVPPQQPSPVPSTQPAAAPQPGAQQSRVETTGAAVREENRTQAAYPANSSHRADNSQQQATLGSRKRCDIQACARVTAARSAHPIAPISRSTVGRDGSAKNLPGSGWCASGSSGTAAGGAGIRRCVIWTARPGDVGASTRTMTQSILTTSSSSAGGLASSAIYMPFAGHWQEIPEVRFLGKANIVRLG